MRRDPDPVGRGGQEPERRASPLPLRATSIVLALWITGLVVLAFVIVPALFATCAAIPAGGP